MRVPNLPEEDQPLQFPAAEALALVSQLERVAGLLETAATARADAGARLTDFKGAYADRYLDWLAGHLDRNSGAAERMRSTAGRLRDAVEDHHHDEIWRRS